MDDKKRKNILSNISEDMEALLTEECVRLGKAALYKELFDTPDWCRWRYHGETPETVEEYALGEYGVLRKVPEWASKRGILDFFRDAVEHDYEQFMAEREHPEDDDE